jgi:hypothetical protein
MYVNPDWLCSSCVFWGPQKESDFASTLWLDVYHHIWVALQLLCFGNYRKNVICTYLTRSNARTVPSREADTSACPLGRKATWVRRAGMQAAREIVKRKG